MHVTKTCEAPQISWRKGQCPSIPEGAFKVQYQCMLTLIMQIRVMLPIATDNGTMPISDFRH